MAGDAVLANRIRTHIAERTHPDCDGDSPAWDAGFKAACSQILAILDTTPRPSIMDGPLPPCEHAVVICAGCGFQFALDNAALAAPPAAPTPAPDYCERCGTYLAGGMIERSADPAFCGECFDDVAPIPAHQPWRYPVLSAEEAEAEALRRARRAAEVPRG